MRVALCLSGEPRDFAYVWSELKNKLNCANIDIYVHTWHSTQLTSQLPNFAERGETYNQTHTDQIRSTEYIYSTLPKNFLVENYYASHPFLRFQTRNIPSSSTRMYSMYYGIQSVINLINYNNYDYIIRMRPDIFLQDKLDWGEIKQQLDDNPKLVLIPDLLINIGGPGGNAWTEKSEYIPDFFSISKSNDQLYFDVYNQLNDICGLHTDPSIKEYGNIASIPELYMAYYLTFKGFTPKKLNFKMILARHNKQILNNQPIL
jgi:hypothetical protein